MFSLQSLGDVAGGEPVDDLDLLLVLGVCHELEHQRVDGQRVEFEGQERTGPDPRNQLGWAAAGCRRVAGEHPVDVFDVNEPSGAVGIGEQDAPVSVRCGGILPTSGGYS